MANIVRNVQSRLKSRKVLGVGENADGDIPRSKVRSTYCSELQAVSAKKLLSKRERFKKGMYNIYEGLSSVCLK